MCCARGSSSGARIVASNRARTQTLQTCLSRSSTRLTASPQNVQSGSNFLMTTRPFSKRVSIKSPCRIPSALRSSAGTTTRPSWSSRSRTPRPLCWPVTTNEDVSRPASSPDRILPSEYGGRSFVWGPRSRWWWRVRSGWACVLNVAWVWSCGRPDRHALHPNKGFTRSDPTLLTVDREPRTDSGREPRTTTNPVSLADMGLFRHPENLHITRKHQRDRCPIPIIANGVICGSSGRTIETLTP
jgi:hypothetical protein